MIPQVRLPNKHKVSLSPQGIGRRQQSNLEEYAPSECFNVLISSVVNCFPLTGTKSELRGSLPGKSGIECRAPGMARF